MPYHKCQQSFYYHPTKYQLRKKKEQAERKKWADIVNDWIQRTFTETHKLAHTWNSDLILPSHLNGVDDNVLNLILTGTLWTWTDIKKMSICSYNRKKKMFVLQDKKTEFGPNCTFCTEKISTKFPKGIFRIDLEKIDYC